MLAEPTERGHVMHDWNGLQSLGYISQVGANRWSHDRGHHWAVAHPTCECKARWGHQELHVGCSSPVRDFRQLPLFNTNTYMKRKALFSTLWRVSAHMDASSQNQSFWRTQPSCKDDRGQRCFFTNPWMTLRKANQYKNKTWIWTLDFFLDLLWKNCSQLPWSANSLLVCIF